MGFDTARLRVLQIDLAEKKFDGLTESFDALITTFHESSQYYYEALASMLLAESLFVEGKSNKVVEPIKRVLDLSSRFDYDYWLRCEIRRNPAIFELEDIVELLPADLRNEIGSTPAVSMQTEAAAPNASAAVYTDLTIKVLGHVEIYRDPSKPFAADAWTTRRSRDIFCYIATSPHRRVSKDTLIDVFWPDEDLDTIERNFHPTISHIRKALNNRQALKQNFLLFRDGAYQLNPELSYSIDTEEFERYISAAQNAKREKNNQELRASLDAANDLYRGEFMSGVYEDWAEERRIFYTEQFGRVVAALAKLAFAEKQWASALKYANQVLKEDPFREDIHRLMLKIYAAQSKPAAVKKHFEEMRELLKKELGISPSAETTRLFEELMK